MFVERARDALRCLRTNLDNTVKEQTGAFVVVLPMKIEGGSGAPLRIVAFVPSGL